MFPPWPGQLLMKCTGKGITVARDRSLGILVVGNLRVRSDPVDPASRGYLNLDGPEPGYSESELAAAVRSDPWVG